MKIIVDTCIWSEAFRKGSTKEERVVLELKELIDELLVQMLGPIRQELLSGIKTIRQFDQLKSHLAAFPDLPITTRDYEKAAEFFNICRRKGIQGSNIDFLICAVAIHNHLAIFTTDKDFDNFAKHLPIRLHHVRSES